MPLYEYLCQKCGHRFERIQKFSDPHVKTCPQCKGRVEQVISAPAIQFKGSGWYATDYPKQGSGSSQQQKADDAGNKADAAKKAGSDSGGKSETKSDSKSDTKSKSSSENTSGKK